MSEELRCLGLLNALEKDQEVPDGLVQLFGEPCIRLAEGIKTYISKVDMDPFSRFGSFWICQLFVYSFIFHLSSVSALSCGSWEH